MRNERILVILNPIAGAGKGKARWKDIAALLDATSDLQFEMYETKYREDAIKLAGEAIAQGFKLIIVVGGDGTINEVINGLLQVQRPEDLECELGIINCGSGAGVAQSLGLPRSIEEQVKLILNRPGKYLDIGITECRQEEGSKLLRFFINECQAGISGTIVSKVGLGKKRWGGTLAFAFQAVSDLLRYPATRIDLIVDGLKYPGSKMLGVAVGNGNYCAGGMKLTPDAVADDGYLDLLTIGDMNLPNRLQTFAKVYRGTHIYSAFCSITKMRTLEISSDYPLCVETDGELIGKTPCKIKIIPKAVRIRY